MAAAEVRVNINVADLLGGAIGQVHIIKVVQVIGDDSVLATLGISPSSVFIEGVDTAEMIDAQTKSMPGLFEVTERRTYETASGAARTTFVLRPFDTEARLKPWLAKEAINEAKED